MPVELTPVVEVGGTHVTAAAVDPAAATVAHSTTLELLDRVSAADLLDGIAEAMATVAGDGVASTWGAAFPGPFDYERGVGRYTGVGKFESLNGVDVGAGLRARLGDRVSSMHFVNDADGVLLGEVAAGHCAPHRRCAAITLGTGVGSAFTADGVLVHDGPGVPPDGEIHLMTVAGVPLEDVMSRRAILRAYRSRGPQRAEPDVREIAELARRGDQVAVEVLDTALAGLCTVLRECLTGFGATVLVVGGSIARSWDLVEPRLRDGLGGEVAPELVLCADSERAALLGAAAAAVAARSGPTA